MSQIDAEKRKKRSEYDHATRRTAGGRYPKSLVEIWEMAARKEGRSLHGFIRDAATAAAVKALQEKKARS